MTDFRIADTFTGSLARLTGDEQKAAKTTAFDLQLNPVNPGMQLHKIEKSKDKNFWSVRAGKDIRLIVHKSTGSLLLCYVDHHGKAYDWARRRRLETHPTTGAAQFVEIRETVQEILVPAYVEEAKPAPYLEPLFAKGLTARREKEKRRPLSRSRLFLPRRLPHRERHHHCSVGLNAGSWIAAPATGPIALPGYCALSRGSSGDEHRRLLTTACHAFSTRQQLLRI